MLDTQAFERLFEGAEEALRPVLLLAFDTGMRKEELLALRWEQIDLDAGTIQLAPEDTKTEEGRLIVLTERAKEALRPMPSGSRKQSSFFSRCIAAMSVRVP